MKHAAQQATVPEALGSAPWPERRVAASGFGVPGVFRGFVGQGVGSNAFRDGQETEKQSPSEVS